MRTLVVIPPEPVVTWEEAKAHLRLDGDDERAFVDALIAAATAHIDGPEGWLGRAIGLQTLEVRLPAFGVTSIALPYPPVVDIVSIQYVDSAGEIASVGDDDYELSGPLLRAAWTKSWPTPQWLGCDGDVVRIRYRAGYAINPDADPVVQNIPAPIRAAILLMVGDLYRFRASASDMNITATAIPMSMTVESLLQPYRVYR
ncbi:head-tail connector protein [Sphingobium abikonense]|uniref:head-tail connector protein n=1 Tax=Sphingobium abikonense TaxID=86193 RepID=UPI003512E37A